MLFGPKKCDIGRDSSVLKMVELVASINSQCLLSSDAPGPTYL